MSDLGSKALIWARGKVGQQVGKGECWDLANQALKNAGARSSADYGPVGPDDDYIWGNEVLLKDAQPGDILQFRDYVMITKTITEVTFADKSGWVDEKEVEVDHPHHTAIVSMNRGNSILTILEQNQNGNHEEVRTSSLRWNSSDPTTTEEHKYIKRSDNGKSEMATVKTTVKVTVRGAIWAYRPQAQ